MQTLQAVRNVFSTSATRAAIAIAMTAALMSGLFVPLSASATVATVNLTAPNGGEYWRDMRNITWTVATTTPSGGDTFTISLSTNSGGSFNTLVAGVDVAPGFYTWDTHSTGAGVLVDGNTYRIKLVAPNLLEDSSVLDFTVDNTAPSTDQTPSFPASGTGWYNIATGVPTITLTCDDGVPPGSGCHNVYYYWDSDAPTVYSVPLTPAEGDHFLHYYSDDNATDNLGVRNIESTNTVEYKVDTANPTAAVTYSDNYVKSGDVLTITAAFNEPMADAPATEVAISGSNTLAATAMTKDTTTSYHYDFSVGAGDGLATVAFSVGTDVAGNPITATPTSGDTFTVDNLDPTITGFTSPTADTVYKGAGTTANILDFTPHDTGGVGSTPLTCSYTVTNAGGTFNHDDFMPCTDGTPITSATLEDLADGRNDVFVNVTDAAGNDIDSSTISFVFDNDDTLTVGTAGGVVGAEDFNTIQEAVTKATAGDTVAVSAGTYGESVTIPAGKDGLALAGNSSTDTFISVPNNTFGIKVQSASVDISGFDIKKDASPDFVTSCADNCGIFFAASGTALAHTVIHDNKIEGFYNGVGGSGAVQWWDITDNTFDNNRTGVFFNTSSNISVSGNTFTNYFAGTGGTEATSDISITDNIFSGSNGSLDADLSGFVSIMEAIGMTDDVDNLTITGNTISGDNAFGIQVYSNGGSGPIDALIEHNNISGTATYGLKNNTTHNVDATENWWGSDEGPTPDTAALNPSGDGDNVSDYVLFAPWCTNAACSPVDTTAPTATLSGTPADPTNVTTTDITVGPGGDVAYYTYSFDGGAYGATTTAATHITLSSLADGPHTLDVLGRDQAGNWQTSPTSFSWTIDTLAPTMTDVHIESDNAKDATLWAKAGDTITITATSSEAINTPTVTIDGNAASVSGGPTLWTATYTMQAGDNEGVIPFTINFTDLATNPGSSIATTDGSAITYDETDPVVEAGTTPQYINLVVSSVVQDATVTESGSGVDTNIWTNTSPTQATSTPYNAEDTTLTATVDGTYTFTLTVEDEAGNVGSDTMTLVRDTVSPFVKAYIPTTGKIDVSTAATSSLVRFNESVGVLDAGGISIVNDGTDVSVANGTSSIIGGDDASLTLQIPYVALDNGTTYRVNVDPSSIRDTAGNPFILSFANHFTTIADLIPPTVDSLTAGSITTTGAELVAATDENASCRYSQTDSAFGSMTVFGTTGTSTAHATVLSGLTPATMYNFYVRCVDLAAAANAMTVSAHVSFTTATPDTMAPVISNIQAIGTGQTTATITWTTDEGADSQVEYGTDSSYGAASSSAALVTSHSILLTGLTAGTTYHFRVLSSDAASNDGVSVDGTFTTSAPSPDTDAPPIPSITTGVNTVNADSYSIAGSAGPDTPSDSVRSIQIYNNDVLAGSAVVPVGQTDWSASVTLTQDLANSFSAVSTDASGNRSATSSAVIITEDGTVGTDQTEPDAPIIDPGIDGITVDADTYELFGTVTADTDVQTVVIDCGCSVVGSVNVPAGETAWALTITLPQDTDTTFIARSIDPSGNISADSTGVTITEQAPAGDTTAPTITSSDPADTGSDVSVSVAPQVVFDEPIDPTTATSTSVQLLDDTDTPVAATLSLANGNTTAVITPNASLNYSSDYHIAVSSGVTDAVGNHFTGTTNYATFTTEDVPADTDAPVITNIRTVAPIGTDSVTITWDTDEAADSEVEYGTDSSYSLGPTAVSDVGGVTNHSVSISGLSADTVYHFRVHSTDLAPAVNSATSGDNVFQTAFDDSSATLAVTGIDAVANQNGATGFASNNDSFDDGWRWTFHVTVPTAETSFAMKFADFVSGANVLFAASNIRYYTAQSSANSASTTAVSIAGANTYPGVITLDSDADASTAGRQINVTVEAKAPVATPAGSYSTSYGVESL